MILKRTQVHHHSSLQLFQDVAKKRIVNGNLRQDGQRISSCQQIGHAKRNEIASKPEIPKIENTVSIVFQIRIILSKLISFPF